MSEPAFRKSVCDRPDVVVLGDVALLFRSSPLVGATATAAKPAS